MHHEQSNSQTVVFVVVTKEERERNQILHTSGGDQRSAVFENFFQDIAFFLQGFDYVHLGVWWIHSVLPRNNKILPTPLSPDKQKPWVVSFGWAWTIFAETDYFGFDWDVWEIGVKCKRFIWNSGVSDKSPLQFTPIARAAANEELRFFDCFPNPGSSVADILDLVCQNMYFPQRNFTPVVAPLAVVKVKAKFDFSGRNEKELTIRKGKLAGKVDSIVL